MPSRAHNFAAGPSTLPLSVLEQAQRDFLELPGVGASVMEISHRSDSFEEVIHAAEENLRALLAIPEGYRVLFLQGGANLQFSMVPMSFLRGTGKEAEYVITGTWGSKAIKEAEKEGSARTIWDGKEDNYTRIPSPTDLKLGSDAAYVHLTSNETIQGVQFQDFPDTGAVPLVCDSSSDFLSRPIPVDRFGILYAGAQKNAGPAGVTIVIVREDLLARIPDDLHTMLDYRTHVDKESLYNTPPSFCIYIVMLVTKWLREEIGGLAAMAEINQSKADLLYDAIDGSGGFYKGHAAPDSRSLMNVTWRLPEECLEKQFIQEAREAGLHELKGHRSVGGIRASIYNAMTLKGVQALADFMAAFQTNHAS